MKIGFDSFILADPALILYLRQKGISCKIHLSGEAGEMNREAIKVFREMGIGRIIFHRKNTVASVSYTHLQLYQGDWPIDLQYQSLPDGVPEISDETLQEVVELPEVETASLYHTRNEYDAVYRGAKSLSNSVILGIDRNYLDVYGYQVDVYKRQVLHWKQTRCG